MLHEEPLGPTLAVAPFTTVEEEIAKANATEYGLASYFFTRSLEIQQGMIRAIRRGAVSVNYLKSADAPNAGIKQSGYGYEGGVEGLRAFRNLKLGQCRRSSGCPRNCSFHSGVILSLTRQEPTAGGRDQLCDDVDLGNRILRGGFRATSTRTPRK